MKCFDATQINQVLLGSGPVPDDWLEHLETCPACRARLEGATGMGDWEGPGEALETPDETVLMIKSTSVQAPPDQGPEWEDVFGERAESELLGHLGPYEVIRVIDRGGMGTVFLARDPRLDREVAIKMVHPEFASSPEVIALFQREARAVAALDHANILAVHDVGETNGRPWIVLPYVAGGTLQDRLDAGERFSAADCRVVGAQVAAALAHAHGHDILHRDIKPSNILFDAENERVLLTDFGLAETLSASKSGQLSGTPEFMSPEQARGEALTAASDLYSLGAVLHSMRTGQSPWQAAGSNDKALEWVRNAPAIELRDEDAEFGKQLGRLLHPTADQRPGSAAEFEADLAKKETRPLANWWFALVPVIAFGLLSVLWPKPGPPEPFQVGERSFVDWESAFAAAEPGMAIELHHDLQLTAPLPLPPGATHLRGIGNPRPILSIESREGLAQLRDQSLVLENLELRLGPTSVPGFIELTNATLSVRDCRMISVLLRNRDYGLTFIQSCGESVVEMEDSEFFGKDMQLMRTKPSSETANSFDFRGENIDVLMSRFALLADPEAEVSISVSNSAFVAKNIIRLLPGEKPVDLRFHGSYIYRAGPLILTPPLRPQQQRVHWHGRDNGISGPGVFLSPRLGLLEEITDVDGSQLLPSPNKARFDTMSDPMTFDFRKLLEVHVPEMTFPHWTRTLRSE